MSPKTDSSPLHNETKPFRLNGAESNSSLLKAIPSIVWLMLLILMLSLFGTLGALAAWGIIAFWVLRGPEEAVEGLLLSMLLTFTNPALFPNREVASFSRWFILLVASARIAFTWFQRPLERPSWFKYLFVFAVYVALTSIFVSVWPVASLIKLTSFAVLVLASYLGIRLGKRDFGTTLIAFGVVIALLSLPLLMSSLGYVRNGTQFQGILSHPQSYGVIISIPLAYAFGRWLLDSDAHLRWYHVVFLGAMMVTVVLSGSRTGYFALILALVISILLHESRKRFVNRLLFNPSTYFGIAAVVIIAWATNPTEQIQQFVFERELSTYAPYGLSIDPNSSAAAYLLASRSSLAEQTWNSFIQHPLFGIGFGISSSPESVASAIIVAGIPVSLPAEKGFMVTAVLEEVGLLGFILLFLMILSQFHIVRKSVRVSVITLFLTAIFVNLGESLYFAPGGIGVLIHIAIAIALVSVEHQDLEDSPYLAVAEEDDLPRTVPIDLAYKVNNQRQ